MTEQLALTLAHEEDVIGLQVAMNEAGLVRRPVTAEVS